MQEAAGMVRTCACEDMWGVFGMKVDDTAHYDGRKRSAKCHLVSGP